jgi:hypothetical protein
MTRPLIGWKVVERVIEAVTADDQECFDFLCHAIEREQLYRFYQTDNGTPIKNMREFTDDLDDESESTPLARCSALTSNSDSINSQSSSAESKRCASNSPKSKRKSIAAKRLLPRSATSELS